jgi:hypothetical protein
MCVMSWFRAFAFHNRHFGRYAAASNVAFSARAIFSKKLMDKMSPLNLYNFLTIVSLLFCIPFVFLFEVGVVWGGCLDALLVGWMPLFTRVYFALVKTRFS